MRKSAARRRSARAADAAPSREAPSRLCGIGDHIARPPICTPRVALTASHQRKSSSTNMMLMPWRRAISSAASTSLNTKSSSPIGRPPVAESDAGAAVAEEKPPHVLHARRGKLCECQLELRALFLSAQCRHRAAMHWRRSRCRSAPTADWRRSEMAAANQRPVTCSW